MGLDMYALTCRERPASPVDFKPAQARRLHYWRKHPDLHGWMERLYREKGGSDEQFNCVAVLLMAEDLNRLKADIRGRRLPHTTGFFFGSSTGVEKEDDLQFIGEAREALAAGLTVFYTSWW